MGTPKFLHHAIRNALCVGPLKNVEQRLLIHIKDFLAQRFGAAMLEYADSPKVERVLKELFDSIVKDPGL